MSNTVWLWNSIFLFLVAYIFYAYTLFSKEGLGKTIFALALFLGASMLMALAFGFCVLLLQGIALRFTIGFLSIAVIAFGLAIVLIAARHARDHH